MTGLVQHTLAEARRRLHNGEVRAEALLSAQLAHIRKHEGVINSFIELDPRAGGATGTLAGVPLANKDIFHYAGRGATAGSRTFPAQSDLEATAIVRQRDAGAALLGVLNLDEFAAGGTGENAHYGRCKNPWDTRRITGGSSGGSAAAVAARFCFGALGSDAGGSIRIPAALCGVVGLKPTYGLVSRHGAMARTWSMDCIGPLARTAEDCAMLLDAVAGLDPNDSSSLDARPAQGYTLAKAERLDVRIGLPVEFEQAELAPAMRTAIDRAVALLRDLGARTVTTQLGDIDRLNALQQVIVKSEGASLLGPVLRNRSDEVSVEAKSVLEEGFLIPATRYIEALSVRAAELEAFVNRAFSGCDLIMGPVVADSAPEHAAIASDSPGAIDRYFSESARFTRLANYLGIPALSVPCGFDENGMPLAFQLTGAPFSELSLLQTAHVFQSVTDYHERAPDLGP